MTLKHFAERGLQFAKSNSTTIFSAFAVSGVIGTAYLAGKASWVSAEQVMLKETQDDVTLDARERVKLVWKNYIPVTVSGVSTIACVIGTQRSGAKKTIAAQAAAAVTERAFSEYREKVIEQIGESKEQKIRDELKQEQVDRNPPMIIAGEGSLCMESHTGRYFRCDIEALRKACNNVNAKMLGGLYATLDDLYEQIGLPYTDDSGHLGWEADRLLELQFSSALYEGKPVLVFTYNYIKPV